MRVMIYFNNSFNITDMQWEDSENLKLFGKLVKEIRKNKSASLNNIAFSRGGVTSATLSRIENGLVDFKFSTLLRLAYTLDIPLCELFKNYNYNLAENDN